MVLYLIGLGLGDHRDITVKGLEIVKSSTAVYLEYYTSILGVDKDVLEKFYERPVILADRDFVENRADEIYGRAKNEQVALLVVGDPLCATTHVDIMLRCRNEGIKVEVVHNASVMNGVASCGLPLYQFGYTVSIPLFEGDWRPCSFYERIQYNHRGGMHTLCLLDIKVKEPDYESMVTAGKVRYLPPRFMTVNVAIDQLLEVEAVKGEGVITEQSLAVGLSRLGQSDQQLVFGTLAELREIDFGAPLHSLVLCGEIHPLEREYLEYLKPGKQQIESS
jgi:diphthine synthase